MGPSTEDQAGAGDRPVEGLSYAEASAELDEIVGFFEGRDVDVDQLVGRLVRATEIIEELDKRLRRTQTQVEQLVPRLTAVLDNRTDEGPSPIEQEAGTEAGTDAVPGIDVEVVAARVSSVGVDDGVDDDVDAGVDDAGTPGLF